MSDLATESSSGGSLGKLRCLLLNSIIVLRPSPGRIMATGATSDINDGKLKHHLFNTEFHFFRSSGDTAGEDQFILPVGLFEVIEEIIAKDPGDAPDMVLGG